MNLLADENIDRSVVATLRQAGHHVLAVSEMEPGIGDATVLSRANEAQALLLTEDTDFGELVFRQRLLHEASSSCDWPALLRQPRVSCSQRY